MKLIDILKQMLLEEKKKEIKAAEAVVAEKKQLANVAPAPVESEDEDEEAEDTYWRN